MYQRAKDVYLFPVTLKLMIIVEYIYKYKLIIYLLNNASKLDLSPSSQAEITYAKPSIATPNRANTIKVSYTRPFRPLQPGNPVDSEKRYANGRNTNNDKFENKNT